MTITLLPMTAAEFVRREAQHIDGYAKDLEKARGMSPEQARDSARKDYERLLPDGLDTADALVYAAVIGGESVGWLWVILNAQNRPENAWIGNIEVDEPHRGKGYGRGILTAIEPILAARGVTRLGLNVFGDNAVARHLYESVGFTVDALQMSKPVRPA